jgi:hypothetical protein
MIYSRKSDLTNLNIYDNDKFNKEYDEIIRELFK